ncbi:hypothetical protein [Methylacidimicrobium sp. AP8]|uniref:hypothetical protein n=1 Tax=Methylacidimicrobium sp. AP8 TaxID=2730359 RepID=UPI001921F6BB|nr:hypothetical protein [Methylacidimicrobium sp. AP8]
MVSNPKWPYSDGDGNETNFRPVLILILLILFVMVLTFGFVLTNRFGVFSAGDW